MEFTIAAEATRGKDARGNEIFPRAGITGGRGTVDGVDELAKVEATTAATEVKLEFFPADTAATMPSYASFFFRSSSKRGTAP